MEVIEILLVPRDLHFHTVLRGQVTDMLKLRSLIGWARLGSPVTALHEIQGVVQSMDRKVVVLMPRKNQVRGLGTAKK